MSRYSGVKREFHFSQKGVSWCTTCDGARCEEDVGFLFDSVGNVQGYIIDSEKLRETVSTLYRGKNYRLGDSSPADCVYKRPVDLKKYISRNPADVGSTRFSKHILDLLLVGVEGCDNFSKGVRNISFKRYCEAKGSINLNNKMAEVLNGEGRDSDIELVQGSGEAHHRISDSNPLSRGY